MQNPLLGRDGAERQRSRSAGVGWFPFPKPLKPPLIQGDTRFSSNVVPERGMKNSSETCRDRGGPFMRTDVSHVAKSPGTDKTTGPG
jgi:hypothetical protein